MTTDPLLNPAWLLLPIFMVIGFASYGYYKAAEELYVMSHGKRGALWGFLFIAFNFFAFAGFVALFVTIATWFNLTKYGVPFNG